MRSSRLRAVLALVVVLQAAACTSFEVEGDGSVTPDSLHGKATVHGCFYGGPWSDDVIDRCESQGLARVEVQTNVLYLLASVLSLGVWVPQSVEWWCSDEGGDDDPNDVWKPGADPFADPTATDPGEGGEGEGPADGAGP